MPPRLLPRPPAPPQAPPDVTRCLPLWSTARAFTGPLWHNILTTGVVMLGDHMVTVPPAWPQHMMALKGLVRSTSQGPSRVLCCATICPVLVSW